VSAPRNYQWARKALLERLVEQGISHPGVLDAIKATPREQFLDEAQSVRAYEDCALPIGQGQTLSQPLVVARMTELALNGKPRLAKVLEIGTGSGYQAAILAPLCGQAFTVERIAAFVEQARARHHALGLLNIRHLCRDGFQGWPSQAPFDAIITTAAPEQIPQALLEQLSPGGRLVIPVGMQGGIQRLTVVTRIAGQEYKTQEHDVVSFVPLLPGLVR